MHGSEAATSARMGMNDTNMRRKKRGDTHFEFDMIPFFD
jgi:hypothetical protein